MNAHFSIEFDDGTKFKGESLPNSQWNKIPKKTIKTIVYNIGNRLILLEGYKQYNHLHHNQALMVGKKHFVSKVLLMGRTQDTTQIIEIDLTSGRIVPYVRNHGKEFMNQILSGWNEGVLHNPNFKVAQK